MFAESENFKFAALETLKALEREELELRRKILQIEEARRALSPFVVGESPTYGYMSEKI